MTARQQSCTHCGPDKNCCRDVGHCCRGVGHCFSDQELISSSSHSQWSKRLSIFQICVVTVSDFQQDSEKKLNQWEFKHRLFKRMKSGYDQAGKGHDSYVPLSAKSVLFVYRCLGAVTVRLLPWLPGDTLVGFQTLTRERVKSLQMKEQTLSHYILHEVNTWNSTPSNSSDKGSAKPNTLTCFKSLKPSTDNTKFNHEMLKLLFFVISWNLGVVFCLNAIVRPVISLFYHEPAHWEWPMHAAQFGCMAYWESGWLTAGIPQPSRWRHNILFFSRIAWSAAECQVECHQWLVSECTIRWSR